MPESLRRKVRGEPRRVWTKFAEPAKDAVEFVTFSRPLPKEQAEAALAALESQRGE